MILHDKVENEISMSCYLLNKTNTVLVGLGSKVTKLNWMTGIYSSDWELPIYAALTFMELSDSLISIGSF